MSNKPSNKDRAKQKTNIISENPFRASAWSKPKGIINPNTKEDENDAITEIFLIAYMIEQMVDYLSELERKKYWNQYA
jgi:hypothetical protein